MQYPETLPLQDHEVVLSFDDGPLPRNSNQVLQILADNCVKATFFEIGEQARAYPEGIRKLVAAGHTVGTHSQRHPLNFEKMTEEQARQEIDEGIESVKAAMVDPNALGPFFRIPGLLRAPPVEAYLETQGIQIWSTDVLADDWHRISPAKVHDLAMKRLHEMGKGILLLHDIQARTVAALPKILQDMKAQGYRIVHVVAATPDQPATPTEPEQWQLHPPSEDKAIARWPKLPNFIYADTDILPAPDATNFDLAESDISLALDPGAGRRGVPLQKETSWPPVEEAPQVVATAGSLPVPAESVFDIPETARDWVQPFPLHMHHYADGEIPPRVVVARAAQHARHARGRRQVRRLAHAEPAATKPAAAKPAATKLAAAKHQAAATRPARAGPKRTVHVASLKKRKI